jgi:putative salt-induced outer membrane protein YdiY
VLFPRLTSSLLRFPFFFVLGLSASSWLAAAQLVLRNGDRVTGEVLSRENGRILFRSALLGDISVAEEDAAIDELAGSAETANQQMADSLAGLPPTPPAEEPAPAKPAVESKAADPAAPKASQSTATVAATAPPAASPTPPPAAQKPAAKPAASVAKADSSAKPSRPSWKGKIEFGFKQQSGRSDRVDYDIRADAQRSLGPNSYRANTRVLYGKLNGRLISDRQEASFRWRRDFSKTVFSQSLTTYYSDVVKSIDHNYEQNVGFGYRLLDLPAHIVNAGLGLTGQYRESTSATTQGYILGEFFEDYTYKINGRFTLMQDFLAQWTSKSASTNPKTQNYKLRFNTALQGRVTSRLSMNVRFEYEFDNAIANRSARTDQRISSSLGYAF